MAKVLFNPTGSQVKITVDGKEYSVDSNSEILVENDGHASYWKETHQFLEVRDSIAPIKVVVESKPEPEIEVDLVSEDVEVEEPVKKNKSKK